MFNPELEQFRAIEVAADQAHRRHAAREVRRQRGVSWAGMAPCPTPLRSDAQIEAAARAALERRRAWERGEGAFTIAIIKCQAAAREAFTLAERARNGASRGEDNAWREDIARELDAQARALADATGQALKATLAD